MQESNCLPWLSWPAVMHQSCLEPCLQLNLLFRSWLVSKQPPPSHLQTCMWAERAFAAPELCRDSIGLRRSPTAARALPPHCSGVLVPGLFWLSGYAETRDPLHANGDGAHSPADYQWQSWIADLALVSRPKKSPPLCVPCEHVSMRALHSTVPGCQDVVYLSWIIGFFIAQSFSVFSFIKEIPLVTF